MAERAEVIVDRLDMIKPPVNQAMRTLDRSRFTTRVPLVAAVITDNKQISDIRRQLTEETAKFGRLQSVRPVKDGSGILRKALLLRPEIRKNDSSTWSPRLSGMLQSGTVDLVNHELELDYDYWNYDEIMQSILPEGEVQEAPHGFNLVGHVAHFNLREEYLPYKNLIAKVVLDKNPVVKTVINKIEQVGAQNPFRTFNYEILAGPHDMNVIASEQSCTFAFDYSKVYWNSKLQGEHLRLTNFFKQGEAVADVMAGVGPFALPAAKKKCFVWANDLNPDSYKSMVGNIERNKVRDFVRPFQLDGAQFIRNAPGELLGSDHVVDVTPRYPRNDETEHPRVLLSQPKTFDHFIMNLPATAIEFLPAFKGIYAEHNDLFSPFTQTKLPLIHVYCFGNTAEGEEMAKVAICEQISELLGYPMAMGDHQREGEASLHDVRTVAPYKHMFCATFRLPPDVAFMKT